MLKPSLILTRSYPLLIMVIGMGSLVIASRYVNMQVRTLMHTLSTQESQMGVQEIMTLLRSIQASNEIILLILLITNLAWLILFGVAACTWSTQISSRAEPDGPANQSQPVGPATNQTSPAAGSGG